MQGGPPWELATQFEQTFEARTGGKHQVDLFPNGQLGSEDAMVSNAHRGALDFSVLAINKITIFSLTVGLLTLRCVIQSADEATKRRSSGSAWWVRNLRPQPARSAPSGH